VYPLDVVLVNPGAETGTTAGWTGNIINLAGGRTGLRRFQCSAASAPDAHQSLVLPEAVLSDVDAGLLYAQFGIYQAGYQEDLDRGRPYIESYDGSGIGQGVRVSGADHSGMSNMMWELTTVNRKLPIGARSLRLGLRGARVTGTNCDVYWDDAFLQLSTLEALHPQYPHAVNIRNSGGDGVPNPVNGLGTKWWTRTNGGLSTSTGNMGVVPRSGDRFLMFRHASGSNPREAFQDCWLDYALLRDVDRGVLELSFTAYQATVESCSGNPWLEFYGEASTIIGGRIGLPPVDLGPEWAERNITSLIPPDTRFIRFGINGRRASTLTEVEVYFDDLSAQIVNTEDSPTTSIWMHDGLGFQATTRYQLNAGIWVPVETVTY